MGYWYDEIPNDKFVEWIEKQKMFWVATAPLAEDGHVNVSPKGRPSFNVAGRNACWYMDMTGSGNETLSHIYENRRITVMFNAFEGPPQIVRLYGKGRVFERGSPEFKALLPDGDERILPGTRAIIWVDIHKVSTSCGFSTPLYDYVGERLKLDAYYCTLEAKTEDLTETGVPTALISNWEFNNHESIDSMRGLRLATKQSGMKAPFKLAQIQAERESEVAASTAIRDPAVVRRQDLYVAIVFALAIGFALGNSVCNALNRVKPTDSLGL